MVDNVNTRKVIEEMIEILDSLVSSGLSGVYEMTYESIEAATVRWEYKGQDGVIHGLAHLLTYSLTYSLTYLFRSFYIGTNI